MSPTNVPAAKAKHKKRGLAGRVGALPVATAARSPAPAQCCHFWRYIAKSAILGFSLAMENLSWRYIANRRNSAILSLLNRRFWRNSRKPGENGDFKAK